MNVLVTGANRGIGLALTREFLECGDTVFAGARHPASAHELKALAAQHKQTLHLERLDVTAHAALSSLATTLAARKVTLDVLVNNAGVLLEGGFMTPFESLSPAMFEATFRVNVTGAVAVTLAFLPLLRRSGHPRIVNISSGAGSITGKDDHGYYVYGASKAALNHWTVGLAHELRPDNIIVTAISPGWVRTDMGGPGAELPPEESARALARTISGLTLQDSGRFLGRSGQSEGYVW